MGAGGNNVQEQLGDASPADADGGEAVGKSPKDGAKEGTKEGGSWGAGAGPPSALAYDSEEERLGALAPQTDADVLMEKRKLKARKMLAKKPGVTLDPRKRYAQRKEERLYERQKAAAAAAARLEAAKETEENKRMISEELRSWDAYELNTRNHSRMIEKEKEDRELAAKKLKKEEEHRLACEEEGLTFDHGVVVSHRRWRASPALATVLPAHPCPAHAMRQSGDGRWILSGGDEFTVRLWDTEAFARKFSDSKSDKKAAKAATLVGAVSADLALGWECTRQLVGHTAAVRDVEFNPLFDGPPEEKETPAPTGGQDTGGVQGQGGLEKAERGRDVTGASADGGVKKGMGGKPNGPSAGEDPPQTEGTTVRLECMLASASADLTVRIWDLSFNPRTARYVLRGHKGVVYACKFAPSGDRLASCSADGTLRMWNVIDGTNVFCYEGHASPVTSLCYSLSGRYLVSCSDIGERAIRVWFAGMPLYDRDPVLFGLRLRWTRSGLIKRVRANTEPSAMGFFLSRQEDRESRESSDESEGEKEFRERLKIPQTVLTQCEDSPCPTQAVSNGFSLTVTILNESGKDTRTEEYYRGCKLVLRARALKKFTGLYVAGVSAEGLWEGCEAKGGCRYGAFFQDIPAGMSLTSGRSIAAGEDINKEDKGVNEVVLRWKANGRAGVGWLTFRAVFRFPTIAANRIILGRETVWVTLRERPPPTPPAALFAAKRLKPRKRNFDTVGRTDLFVKALRAGDWAEATMMLSSAAKLQFGKVKATGAAEVAEEIRKVLGRNTIVHNGLSVGVAWTSVCISHEPPDRSKEEEQASAAAAVEAAGANEKGDTRKMPETLTVPETEKHLDDHAPESPGSIDTAAVTVATGHPAAGRQKLKQRPGYDNRSPNQTSKRLAEDKESRKKKIKGRERRAGGEGSDGDGTGRSGGSGGSGGEKTGGRVRRQRQQRRDQRRPKSIGAFSPREERARRGRGRGKHRGSTSDRSSGEEERAEIRESLERKARAELAQLRRLKAAGVRSWKELGEATGLLSLAKTRKRKKAKAKGESKGLLDAAGIAVKDPKINLKVLVWDGFFGADVKEMRMPLPDLYPSSSAPYDQNEDFAARTMGEAIAIGDKAAPALIEEMRAEQQKRVDTVGKMVDAVLDRDEQLRKIGVRRRDAIVSPSGLAASFPVPDARLAPLPRKPLYPLGNGENHKGEATATGAATSTEAPHLAESGGTNVENIEEKVAVSRDADVPLAEEVGFVDRKGEHDGEERTVLVGSSSSSKEALVPLLTNGSDNGQQQHKGVGATLETAKNEADGEQYFGGLGALSPRPSAITPGDGGTTSAAMTKVATMPLPPLEASIVHAKLEGTASREKRQKQEERLAKRPPPADPPEDIDLARRRGGLGVLPGGASLIEVPAVGDWEKQVARENGGLLRELETRFGGLVCHQDTINAVAYSPDGRRLASASSDGTIKLWDPSAGKQVRLLTGHHEGLPVWDVAWSGDSAFLVSCGADRSLVIWNTAAAEPFVRRFLGHSDHVKRCAFADPRGEAVLSCGSDGTVRKWVLTPNVPAPPPKPFVTHKTRTWVMLNWRPAAGSNEEITAYVISWRLGRKGKFGDELTVAGDQLRRDVTGLLPGSLYFFRVAGVNRMGQGPWSETTDMVDTEMDLPLAMERPNTEGVTPDSITVSFFAPRPTLPKMKIQRFVLQAKGGGLDFDEGESQGFTWDEAMAGAAALRGRKKMLQAKAQRESKVFVATARSAASTATRRTGEGASGGASDGGAELVGLADTSQEGGRIKAAGAAGGDGGSTESGSVGSVRLGSFSTLGQGAAQAAAGEASSQTSGSVGLVALGSLAESSEREPAISGTEGTGAAEGAAEEGGGGDQDARVDVSTLESSAKGNAEVVTPTGEVARGIVVGQGGSDESGSAGIVRPGSSAGGDIDKGAAATAATMARAGEAATVENRDGSAQGGQTRLVTLGNSAGRNNRIGRVDYKLRTGQWRGRKAHHYLMSLTYTGLRPGMDYHIRIAGVSSVGQGAFSPPTYSARTPAVAPSACPPPTSSAIFLTAILVSWAEGDDGGSSVTGFILRPTGGGEAEELPVPRTKRSHLVEGLLKGRTYSFQVRAVNNEGIGPWSDPSHPARTLTQRPSAPRAPALSLDRPSPGPLSLWLSLFLPDEDGGDPVTAMLLETRRHGGIQPPEWSRCERHPVPSDLASTNSEKETSDDHPPLPAGASSGGGSRERGGSSRSVGGGVGGTAGHRQLGGRGSIGDTGPPSVTRKTKACCEVVVLVDGLQPRAYYSFRASAVNARGAGDPGPPCRRVRTAAPRPPSWSLAQNDTDVAAVAAAVGTDQSATKSRESSCGAAARLSCSPPRAACSGLGACTVLWEEPFSNGAAIGFYEVEAVRIGPRVAHIDVGVMCMGKQCEGAHDPAGPIKERKLSSNAGKKRSDNGEDAEPNQPPGRSTSSPLIPKTDSDEGQVTLASPPPPPEVVIVPVQQTARRRGGASGRRGGREEVAREVIQKFRRSVPSRLRHFVVRGLVKGGDYVFRVRGSNAAGLGAAGPWTEVVRVEDPADEG